MSCRVPGHAALRTEGSQVIRDLRVGRLPGTLAKSAGFSAWYKYLQTSCRPPRGTSRGDHFARYLSNRRLSVPGCRLNVTDYSLVAARGVVYRVFPGCPVGSPGCSPSRNARSVMVRHLIRRPRWRLRRLPDSEKRTTGLMSEMTLETVRISPARAVLEFEACTKNPEPGARPPECLKP
jgi:hypothetical protein